MNTLVDLKCGFTQEGLHKERCLIGSEPTWTFRKFGKQRGEIQVGVSWRTKGGTGFKSKIQARKMCFFSSFVKIFQPYQI